MSRSDLSLPPDQDQRDLILNLLDRNMLVEAAAGTGKTTSMVGRMISLIRTGNCTSVRSLAAVTFTRKAAAELRARFQVELEREAREARNASSKDSAEKENREQERLEQALADIEHCFIGTIHSFCGRLLRERPVEAGVDVSFTELDDRADMDLREEAWEDFCALTIALDPDGLLGELNRLGLGLGKLKPAFTSFADYPDVDTWPMPWDGAPMPDLAPAVTVLKEYLSHMRAVAPLLPRDTGNDTLILEYRRLPRLATHYDDLNRPEQLMELLERFDRNPNLVQKVWTDNGAFTKEEAKAEKKLWDDFRHDIAGPLMHAWRIHRYAPVMRVMFAAREVYDRMRRERGTLNFQDLLLNAAALLRDKPHVRAYFAERYSHLLVDEFQDTDPVQAEVMLLLTATDLAETDWRRCVPRPGSLFVVGDPKQSIYRFRRADIVTYNEVKRIIAGPESGKGLLIRLSTNFRSSGEIVEWVNHTFEPGPGDEETGVLYMPHFPAVDSETSPAYVPLTAGKNDYSRGELNGFQTLDIDESFSKIEKAVEWESDFIARYIRHALDSGMKVSRSSKDIHMGTPEAASPDDFMIVTRTKKYLSIYARALQKYGIPHQVTGGSAMNEVEELKLLLACVRAVIRPDDPVALVAALRSELFGVSDPTLFSLKKQGGRFSYHAALPGSLPPGASEHLGEAFELLRTCESWLATLPPISALEKMVDRLGLAVLASTHAGGDVQAGSLAKALEVLRSAQGEMWTTTQLVELLERLVSRDEPFDGISARSGERPQVRVMNLHKVKGLESPVVFLACPSGGKEREVELYIDRSGSNVLGYMAISGEKDKYGNPGPPYAYPEGWEEASRLERGFLSAEALRLLYVAATRAGSALIVTQRTKGGKNAGNPWRYFQPVSETKVLLPDPGEQAAPGFATVTVAPEEARSAQAGIAQRLACSTSPTFDVRAAKEYALSLTSEPTEGQMELTLEQAGRSGETPGETAPSDGEHGVEWGSVIHLLLEAAARETEYDLTLLAEAALAENGLDAGLAPAAVALARSVLGSEVWRRSKSSGRSLAEVPFHYLLVEDNTLPTLLRGTIDLAFREEEGWVLVDYKTDRVTGSGRLEALARHYAPQLRLYARAWEHCTGEPVKEMLLFFVDGGATCAVS